MATSIHTYTHSYIYILYVYNKRQLEIHSKFFIGIIHSILKMFSLFCEELKINLFLWMKRNFYHYRNGSKKKCRKIINLLNCQFIWKECLEKALYSAYLLQLYIKNFMLDLTYYKTKTPNNEKTHCLIMSRSVFYA